LPPTAVETVFLALSVLALGSAVLVVTTAQIVHAALWLVVTLGSLAGCYLVLTAEFVAWMQVLVYVGAVVVLLLFGLMLTRAPIGVDAGLSATNRWVALVAASATGVALATVVAGAMKGSYVDLRAAQPSTTRVIGESLFASWVLPFEALSVLLLAALVGAIVISRSDDAAHADERRG
jgi:NADH-quinone oxidoreductase subunit J